MNNNDSRGPQPTADTVTGNYDVHKTVGADETYFYPAGLWLAQDGRDVWAYFEWGPLTGVFHAPGGPSGLPGNIGTLCRCRFSDPDGGLLVYNGSRAAPCQSVNYLGDGTIRGMVRYGRDREQYVKFEARRSEEGHGQGKMSAGDIRGLWEDMIHDL